MKVDYETVKKRRDDMMTLIQKLGTISVHQLSQEFSISEITVRRDLQYWEDRGAIVSSYGGAKLVQQMVDNDDVSFTNNLYKHAIAKYAAGFVDNYDTIFINTSSTALLIIRYIRGKYCTIITNNAKAVDVEHDEKVQIILTGGELRYPKETMVGDFALNNITRVNAKKCFLGCSGISARYGISTAIMMESSTNEAMLAHTQGKRYIVCDHTKIGLRHDFMTSEISMVDTIITDIAADSNEVEELRASGREVILLKPLQAIPEI